MISVAQSGVKVSKMKWAGMIPAATLWASGTIAEVGEKFFDEEKPFQRPLASIIDKLIDCRSAAHVVVTLSQANNQPTTTLATILAKLDTPGIDAPLPRTMDR